MRVVLSISEVVSNLKMYAVQILLAHEIQEWLSISDICQIIKDGYQQTYTVDVIQGGCRALCDMGFLKKNVSSSSEDREEYTLSTIGHEAISIIRKIFRDHQRKLVTMQKCRCDAASQVI